MDHSFPLAQQAQIIRANQRDLFHLSSLKDQVEGVLRSWLGTRWLTRWDKEVDFLIRLCYYGLTTAKASQTLGEEYTDIWQYSTTSRSVPPSASSRALLILASLTPSYALARCAQTPTLLQDYPWLAKLLRGLPSVIQTVTEANLALFYLKGTYYSLSKRLLGIRHLSSVSQDPHTRPPSYSLLGLMIGIRLLYRLVVFLRQGPRQEITEDGGKTRAAPLAETYLDNQPVSSFLDHNSEREFTLPAEEDDRTALDVASIPPVLRALRNCTLCLEERTESCSTECGHLFCWSCIVGWASEKAECPLCRQAVSLERLLPIYNL